MEIEIGVAIEIERQTIDIRQTGTGIGGSEAGDVDRRVDRLAQRTGCKNRGAGLPFVLPQISGDGDRFVPIVFDGFDFAAADRYRLPETVGNVDFACTGRARFGISQNILRQFPERVEGMTEAAVAGS